MKVGEIWIGKGTNIKVRIDNIKDDKVYFSYLTITLCGEILLREHFVFFYKLLR
jgi:hypothetical protein